MNEKYQKTVISAILVISLAACAPKTPDEFDNGKALYEYANKLFEDKHYTDAAEFFEAFKNRYPTSPFITEAEFKLGESYFRKRDYIEAVYAFQNFKSLHPTNSKVPMATFRIAQSYYRQIPGSIDKDQTNTQNCINVVQELLAKYPDFEETAKAQEMLLKCKRMLARRELYVANFYLKKKAYKAAAARLEIIKTNYSFKDLLQEATYKLAKAYYKLKDKEQTKKYLAELIGMDPDENYRKKATDLLKKIDSKKD